jgi:hypothetical protein
MRPPRPGGQQPEVGRGAPPGGNRSAKEADGAKALTLDGVTLYELGVNQNPAGQLTIQAVYALTTGGQVVTTSPLSLAPLLQATETAAVTAAMTAIQGALVRTQIG